MIIILKKIPMVQRAKTGERKITNSQAIKIMSLLAGKFGMNVEIPIHDAITFLHENRTSFTRHHDAGGIFIWYLKSFVAEGYAEVLGGEMDKRMKRRGEIENRIKMLEESISKLPEYDDDRESMEAVVVALRWAIGTPSKETREAKGNIWK